VLAAVRSGEGRDRLRRERVRPPVRLVVARGAGRNHLDVPAILTLSLTTVAIAHVTFSISYVTVIVRGRLAGFDRSIEEAGLDLGATRFQTVRLVVLPQLWPAIAASGMLVFVMSFDDFVTSFFTSGSGVPPLPVRIYSMIKFSVSPEINAIGTLMMAVTLGSLLAAGLLVRRSSRQGLRTTTPAELA
jgi:spermidine/putrescine transport system permease protein